MFDAFPTLVLFLRWFGFMLSFFLLLCLSYAKANFWPFLKYKCFNLIHFAWIQPAHILSVPITLPIFFPKFLHFYFVMLLYRGTCFNELYLILKKTLIRNFHLLHSNNFFSKVCSFLTKFCCFYSGISLFRCFVSSCLIFAL